MEIACFALQICAAVKLGNISTIYTTKMSR